MKTEVKERPILFSGPMVQAILDGTKTETRRIVKPQPRKGMIRVDPTHLVAARFAVDACRYGKPGDRLWVRETWAKAVKPRQLGGSDGFVRYRADNEVLPREQVTAPSGWKPSIHMPRWASRISLLVKEVRCERLHDITEAGAEAEGVLYDQGWEDPPGYGWLDYLSNDDNYRFLNARDSYRSLWEKINGKKSWQSNPWVWVIKFVRVR